MIIEIKDLPKVSSNKIYSGSHWSFRKKLKDKYIWLVKSQFKGQLLKNKQYKVKYCFEFKRNPLDASNCSYMVKMIEDIIFQSDGYKIIQGVYMESKKGTEDKVTIEVTIL